MAEGQVKWFNDNLGYGIIVPASGGEEVYVHFSEIEEESRSLAEGDQVLFEPIYSRKGPQATHVRKFDRAH